MAKFNFMVCDEMIFYNEQYNTGLLKMAQCLSQAILLEVTISPKPGLVTRYDTGSHSDMSILTFMMSSPILIEMFLFLEQLGYTFNGTPKELFNSIRYYGMIAESKLFAATKNVNTQKGILFSGGVLSAAAGYSLKKLGASDKDSVLHIVKEMTEGLMKKELISCQPRELEGMTAGEYLFNKYNVSGIRGEVESGFFSVDKIALPALEEAFQRNVNLNDACVHALICLISKVMDTNVLWRTKSISIANQLQEIASEIIKCGSVFSTIGRERIKQMEEYCIVHNISPGGSADLLSITLALFLYEHENFPCDIK